MENRDSNPYIGGPVVSEITFVRAPGVFFPLVSHR